MEEEKAGASFGIVRVSRAAWHPRSIRHPSSERQFRAAKRSLGAATRSRPIDARSVNREMGDALVRCDDGVARRGLEPAGPVGNSA
jgi:hypothetical protein